MYLFVGFKSTFLHMIIRIFDYSNAYCYSTVGNAITLFCQHIPIDWIFHSPYSYLFTKFRSDIFFISAIEIDWIRWRDYRCRLLTYVSLFQLL